MADIGTGNWNENDTNNNQPAPDGAPEGMSPSGLNDTIRAVMGALKRWFNWSSPKVTAGSATASYSSKGPPCSIMRPIHFPVPVCMRGRCGAGSAFTQAIVRSAISAAMIAWTTQWLAAP